MAGYECLCGEWLPLNFTLGPSRLVDGVGLVVDIDETATATAYDSHVLLLPDVDHMPVVVAVDA